MYINLLGLLCITVIHLSLAAVCRTERHRYRLRYVLATRIAVIAVKLLDPFWDAGGAQNCISVKLVLKMRTCSSL